MPAEKVVSNCLAVERKLLTIIYKQMDPSGLLAGELVGKAFNVVLFADISIV